MPMYKNGAFGTRLVHRGPAKAILSDKFFRESIDCQGGKQVLPHGSAQSRQRVTIVASTAGNSTTASECGLARYSAPGFSTKVGPKCSMAATCVWP